MEILTSGKVRLVPFLELYIRSYNLRIHPLKEIPSLENVSFDVICYITFDGAEI